jgi:hypothetical protein
MAQTPQEYANIGRSEGAAKKPEDMAKKAGPKNTVDHGLHPGQQPNDPPERGAPHDEGGRPRDTGRHGA